MADRPPAWFSLLRAPTPTVVLQKEAMASLGHEPYVVGHQGKVKESPYGMCFLIEGAERWFARQFVAEQSSRTFAIPEWLARESGLYLEVSAAQAEMADDEAA